MQVLEVLVLVAEEAGLSTGEQDRLGQGFAASQDWAAASAGLMLAGTSFLKLQRTASAVTEHFSLAQDPGPSHLQPLRRSVRRCDVSFGNNIPRPDLNQFHELDKLARPWTRFRGS